MTVSTVSETYVLFVEVATASSTSTAPTGSTEALPFSVPAQSSPELSPLAQILSQLQQLQQDNPAEYKQITGQIATNLQSAAQTAQTDGNSTASSQLNQLATDFNNASQTGQLPDIQDLAQTVSGSGHHHHGHHHHSSSTAADSATEDSANSTTGTSSSGSSTGVNDQAQSQLVSSAYGNIAQNDSLSPLAIILNALSSTATSAQTAD